MTTVTKQRFYIRKSLVSVEEDEYNEFKGHRNFAVEELPPWCFHRHTTKRSRKAASRYKYLQKIIYHIAVDLYYYLTT